MFAFLAAHGGELFAGEDIADLFPSARGRPSVPASVMASVPRTLKSATWQPAVGPGRWPLLDLLQVDQAAPGRFGDGLSAAPDRQLAVDPGGVSLDRGDGDAKAAGDALVGHSGREHPEHLAFTAGQRRGWPGMETLPEKERVRAAGRLLVWRDGENTALAGYIQRSGGTPRKPCSQPVGQPAAVVAAEVTCHGGAGHSGHEFDRSGVVEQDDPEPGVLADVVKALEYAGNPGPGCHVLTEPRDVRAQHLEQDALSRSEVQAGAREH